MLSLSTRISIIVTFLFLFSTHANANDSDVVNCNRAWKIAVLGSSTAFGTGATTYDSSWVGKFTAYVKRKNINNIVYNLGIPGYTTYENLCPTGFTPPPGRPSPNSSFNITAALALQPDAIIINMPSNDAANNFTIAEQQANFERTMVLADAANIPVWVATTQPRNNMDAGQILGLTAMRDWILTRFGNKAVDFWSTVANPDGSIVNFYDYDNVHLNNSGHDLFYKRMMAETILDSLCIRVTQTLVANAGTDVSLTLPTNSTVLDGSASFSSNGGVITGYQWTKVSGPLSNLINSPNAAITTISNLTEGRYSFVLTVTDNALNVKTDTVNVVVSSRILIDFGPDVTSSPDVNNNYWNTILNAQPGIKLLNAITTGNISTTIGLEVVNRIDGTFNVGGPGTANPNTLGALNDYPATVTSDYAFADPSATNGSWKITGLESSKQYTIKFWGTRSGVADDRIIEIKRADQNTWLEYNAAGNSNYNTAAVFTFSGKTEMSFDIRVKSGSAFGYISLIDISRTFPKLSVNIPPVARAGNDITVSLPGTTTVLDGSNSSDEDGVITSYQWTQLTGPQVSLILSPAAAVTNVNNLIEGVYSYKLTVMDDSSAVRSDTVFVTVSSRVLIDFGSDVTSTPDANGKYWNTIPDAQPGIKLQNAITTGNTATSISLEVINRIDGTFNPGGPGTSINSSNPVGIINDYPATATSDYAFADPSATNGSWKIAGLDNAKQYSIKFWGTRSVGDDRIIEIKRADETTWQEYNAANNTNYNTAAVFSFTGKTEMSFDIRVKSGSAFGYISLIDINLTTPPITCTPAISISSNQVGGTCSGSSITFSSIATNGGTIPTYQWKKNGVNITGATGATYTTTTIINNDVISCVLTVNDGCAVGSSVSSNNISPVILPIVPKAGTISGPTDVCPLIGTANNATYSIAPLANATTYTWIVPAGATIISGQGTTSITVSFNSGFGTVDTIKVSGGLCTNSVPSKLVLVKNIPGFPGTISGPIDACPFIGLPINATYSIAPVTYATSYTWTMPVGAVLINGQGTTSIQVSYLSTFVGGSIKVSADANCGSRAPKSLNILKTVPAAPAAINGPTSACPYIGTTTPVNYSIAPVANATSYIWTLPANVTLISGQGTTSIAVTFNASYVTSSIKVKSVSNCANSSDKSLSVTTTTTTTPGTISGSTNACEFIGTTLEATYTINRVPNATSYIWSVPAGASIMTHPAGAGINDTIVTVSFNNNFVSGTNISVQSSAGCIPSVAKTLAILRRGSPATPGLISGPTNPCPFIGAATIATYTVRKVSAATTYNWVIPAGTSATHPAGQGINDTIIELTYQIGFLSGTISVTSSNGCGSNNVARSLAVKAIVPTTTPTITGPTDPCPWIGTAGATYKIAKIANATSYTWTVPATGATAIHPNGAGINDTIIIVNFTNAFTSGGITARADAICGSSATRTLTLSRILPSIPGVITTTLITDCPDRIYSYSIASIPANSTSVTWAVPPGATLLSGQGTTNIVVLYPSSAITATLTAAGTNACGNSSSLRTLNISLPLCSLPRTSIQGKNNNNEIIITAESSIKGIEAKVMPNPTQNEFKLVVTGSDKITPVYLRVSDVNGRMIENKKGISIGQTITIGGNYYPGIYIAEFIQGDKRKVIKLFKL